MNVVSIEEIDVINNSKHIFEVIGRSAHNNIAITSEDASNNLTLRAAAQLGKIWKQFAVYKLHKCLAIPFRSGTAIGNPYFLANGFGNPFRPAIFLIDDVV